MSSNFRSSVNSYKIKDPEIQTIKIETELEKNIPKNQIICEITDVKVKNQFKFSIKHEWILRKKYRSSKLKQILKKTFHHVLHVKFSHITWTKMYLYHQSYVFSAIMLLKRPIEFCPLLPFCATSPLCLIYPVLSFSAIFLPAFSTVLKYFWPRLPLTEIFFPTSPLLVLLFTVYSAL